MSGNLTARQGSRSEELKHTLEIQASGLLAPDSPDAV